MEENKKIMNWNYKNRDMEVFPTKSYFSAKGEPIMYGVNWTAKGTVEPNKAKDFVERLQKAIKIAEEESEKETYGGQLK